MHGSTHLLSLTQVALCSETQYLFSWFLVNAYVTWRYENFLSVHASFTTCYLDLLSDGNRGNVPFIPFWYFQTCSYSQNEYIHLSIAITFLLLSFITISKWFQDNLLVYLKKINIGHTMKWPSCSLGSVCSLAQFSRHCCSFGIVWLSGLTSVLGIPVVNLLLPWFWWKLWTFLLNLLYWNIYTNATI